MSNNILLVTGVSASGKDFIIEKAKSFDQRIGSAIPVMNMGSAILSKINEESATNRVIDRDEIRRIEPNEKIREVVRSIVADLIKCPAAVVNGHITYRQKGQLVSNPDIDVEINPAAYVVVVAEPKDIAERRAKDASRSRENESVDQIAYQQQFTIESAERIATSLGVECQIIENTSGNACGAPFMIATMVGKICPR